MVPIEKTDLQTLFVSQQWPFAHMQTANATLQTADAR
jgi:hypothetical protein